MVLYQNVYRIAHEQNCTCPQNWRARVVAKASPLRRGNLGQALTLRKWLPKRSASSECYITLGAPGVPRSWQHNISVNRRHTFHKFLR